MFSLNQDIKICVIMLWILICNFVLVLHKNSPLNNKLFIKVLQYYVKHAFRDGVFFQKTKQKLIYKEKCRTVKKIKIVKNVIIKKSGTKLFQVCISIKYDNFILELYFFNFILEALVLLVVHCYCGDNVKLLSRQLFQRKWQYGGWKNLTLTTNF